MLQIASILAYVSIFSVLLPIFFLLRRKQNFLNTIIKVLGVLLFVSAFSDLISYIIIKMGKTNLPITNTFVIIQFFLLSYIYYLLLKNKKIIYTALIIFTGFFIINNLFIESINEYQSWSRFVAGIFILIYSMSYYLQLLDDLPAVSIFRFSPFWLNTAVFYYFGANFLIFLCTNYIMKNMSLDTGMIAYSFHNLNNIIKNILFMVAISYVGVKQAEAYDGKDM